MLGRRAFLQRLAAAAVGTAFGAAYDWDRLLWVPGERRIFLPSDAEFCTLLTPEWVVREVGRRFFDTLKLSRQWDRAYDSTWVIR